MQFAATAASTGGVRRILLRLREGAVWEERGADAVSVDEMQWQLGEQMARHGALPRARETHECDDDPGTRLVLRRHVALTRRGSPIRV
jgi:hypothetical protein